MRKLLFYNGLEMLKAKFLWRDAVNWQLIEKLYNAFTT